MTGMDNSHRLVWIIAWIALLFTTFWGWPRTPETVNSTFTAPNSPKGVEMEFGKVTDEIRLRLEHEHNLYLYQFILIGGVLTVLVGTSGIMRQRGGGSDTLVEGLCESSASFLCLGLMAVALLIVDTNIRLNALVIQSLGDWIRLCYEPWEIPPKMGWEQFWRNDYSRVFAYGRAFLFIMLYLPAIMILCALYALIPHQKAHDSEKSGSVRGLVFVGVQINLALFCVVNNWPHLSLSLLGWIIAVIWLVLFLLVSVWGFKELN